MTTLIQIEVRDGNPFNRGWLFNLLGLDRPDEESDPEGANGWDLASRQPTAQVRKVFAAGSESHPYIVEEVEVEEVPNEVPVVFVPTSPKRAKADAGE